MIAENDRLFYDLGDMCDDVYSIVNQIREKGVKYDMISGISRGGLIPGVCISHALGVPFETYTIALLEEFVHRPEKKLLIVDDIIDGGKTFSRIQDWIENTNGESNIHFAALIHNADQHKINPHYIAQTIWRTEEPRWIDFWWECLIK